MSTERLVDLAVVGCGLVFERYHLQAIGATEGCRLVAACDTQVDRLDCLRRHDPNVATFESVAELLDATDAAAVLIATPPAVHSAAAIVALLGGRHVLMEKPLSTTLADADKVISAAGEADRLVAVGFNRRFRTSYQALKLQMNGFDPGRIRAITYRFVVDQAHWPCIDRDPSDALVQMLHDVASHAVDLIPWVLDRRIRRVRVMPGGSERRTEIELDLGFAAPVRCIVGHDECYEEKLEVELDSCQWIVEPGGLRRGDTRLPAVAESFIKLRAGWDLTMGKVLVPR